MVINAIPVSHPETQIDARVQMEKTHREEDQERNLHLSSFQGVQRERDDTYPSPRPKLFGEPL